jgi:Kelch motif/Galactose oxidase, central domain
MGVAERSRKRGLHILPLALVAALVLLLPLSALIELPLERQTKDLLGIEYKPPGCSPVRDRGSFGAWRAEGKLPTLLEEGRAVRVGDSAYVVGGLITPVVDNVGRSTAAFRRFDIESGRFTSLPPLPERLNHVGIATDGEAVYVVGGLGDQLEFLSTASSSTWRYDIASRRWTELAPMPTARGALGAAIGGDTLYAIGGRDGPNSLDAVEAYDIHGDSWSVRAPLPVAADHLGVAALGGSVYVVGGRYDGGDELRDFRRYDPRQDRWHSLPDLPTGTSGVNLERVGDELVVTGGEDSEQAYITGLTYAFDPRAGRWRELPPSPRPKHGYASFASRDRLYVLGGARCAGSTPVATIESLRVEEARR